MQKAHFGTIVNSRGAILEKIIEEYNLTVINNKQHTYQTLDVSIVPNHLALKSQFMALEDTLGSDHCPASTKFSLVHLHD